MSDGRIRFMREEDGQCAIVAGLDNCVTARPHTRRNMPRTQRPERLEAEFFCFLFTHSTVTGWRLMTVS
jgi:hypothetical protein